MKRPGFRPSVRVRPKKGFFIGLMSGTSADGVEAALISAGDLRSRKAGVSLIAHKSFPFPKPLKGRILRLSEFSASSGIPRIPRRSPSGRSPPQTTAELTALHFALGERFAAAAIGVAEAAGVNLSDVTAIGSHGQTVCHRPPLGPRTVGATLQIGEAAVISERTGVTTIADFRPADVAAGGLGAPLTPYPHAVLFSRPDRPVLVVNLGGIANVTWIPPAFQPEGPERPAGLRGFDTGPANMLLDAAVMKFSRGRAACDRGGKMASRGEVEDKLLCHLMGHPFIRRKPPKATGREGFGAPFLEGALKAFLDLRGRKAIRFESQAFCDFMATLAAFTARSIGKQVKRFLADVGEAVVCGGGARNPVLMQGLRAEFPSVAVVRSDDRGIPSEAVEAVSFALLARATLLDIPASVPEVTGARRPVVHGKIVPGGAFSKTSRYI